MRKQIHTANIGEYTVRKTVQEIIKFCEGKGYEAEREKDYRMRDYYFQHADHWKRVQNENR